MPARTAPSRGERFVLRYRDAEYIRINQSRDEVFIALDSAALPTILNNSFFIEVDPIGFVIPLTTEHQIVITTQLGEALRRQLADCFPSWNGNHIDRLLFEMRNAGIWFSDLAIMFSMPSAAATSARYNRICRLNNITDAYQGDRQRNRTAPSGRRLSSNRTTHFGTLEEQPEWVTCFDDLGWVNDHSDQLAFAIELELAGLSPMRACEVITSIVPTHPDTSYRHTVYETQWKVVPDGSVPNGCEIVSPPLRGANGIDQLRRVCIAVANAGGRVTVKAGVHIHIGLDDIHGNRVIQPDSEGSQIIFRHAQWQPVWNRLTQTRRHNGRWSKTRIMTRAVALADRWRSGDFGDGGDRYYSLNLCSYVKYGTFEFRQHHSSLNPARIATWIAMHLQMFADVNAGTDCYSFLPEDQQMRWVDDEEATVIQHTLVRNIHPTLQAIGTAARPTR